MLLTSGQVSVAISSFVVFLFTSALFLSGYVLQQQTVRDLRAAIKPKPTPESARMYLPKQFAPQPAPSPKAEVNGGLGGVSGEQPVLTDNEGVVEVKPSNSNIPADKGQFDTVALDDMEGGRSQRPKQDDLGDVAGVQKPIGMAYQQSEAPNDTPSMQYKLKEKPLSRAERRKKIKEEILAAGEGEGFKGYKRRQW